MSERCKKKKIEVRFGSDKKWMFYQAYYKNILVLNSFLILMLV